jgi:hypothetical protein
MTTTNFGDNPFAPGKASDAYIPDQLIAGDAKVVTDTGIITGAALLARGSVLGQVLIGAAGAAVAGVNTGNGVISAIVPQAKAKVGTYTLRFTGATTYDEINRGYAAGAYADAEINFTFTAGGTPMVAGDTFTIPVAAGSLAYKLAAAAAVDGSATPAAILADTADASGGDVTGSIYLSGEFNQRALVLGAGITTAGAKAALRPVNIFVKTSTSAADPT